MKTICTIILAILLIACENKYDYHPSEKEKTANFVIKITAMQIKRELNLIPCGSGGQMMDQIKMLALFFDCHRQLDIETGRKLLIASVEKFAFEVNGNEIIRPYLNNYPFGPKNIEIAIYIQRENGLPFDPEDLCVITAKNGILKYHIKDPNGPRFKTVCSETYEEAIEKLGAISNGPGGPGSACGEGPSKRDPHAARDWLAKRSAKSNRAVWKTAEQT